MTYLQNPVTMIKGAHIVKDVYRSDLQSWLDDGYFIQGEEPIAPKKKAKSTPVEPE